MFINVALFTSYSSADNWFETAFTASCGNPQA
jgi:hypothetical protein